MKQRFALALTISMFAVPLAAQDIGSQIADQLRAQGYKSVEITKTWLGRLRLNAANGAQRREIIVNPRTGEILRDFLSGADGAEVTGPQILDRAPSERAPSGAAPSGAPAGSGPASGPGPGSGPGASPGGGPSK
ncbi:MAG: hypothetical protein WBC85_09745 [Planktotalea sp.]|uniref:hypothetical protein n=1 Tax=Planktotalea sp. TaxID=2029877 RepID=UPI003C71E73A